MAESKSFSHYDVTLIIKGSLCTLNRRTRSDLSNFDGLVNNNAVIDNVHKLLLEQQIKTSNFHVRLYFSQLTNIQELAASHVFNCLQ